MPNYCSADLLFVGSFDSGNRGVVFDEQEGGHRGNAVFLRYIRQLVCVHLDERDVRILENQK